MREGFFRKDIGLFEERKSYPQDLVRRVEIVQNDVSIVM